MLTGGVHPSALTLAELEDAWARATFTSVDELLAEVLCRADGIPDAIREQAVSRMREAHAREIIRNDGLRPLVEALAAAGVRALLMKGGAVAYTVYPAPHLRPSGDVDLLIARDSRAAADAALLGVGYRRQLEPDSELASMQQHYVRPAGPAVEHLVDLHWAASNRHVFAHVLQFEDAWAASQPVPMLGGARALGTVDALLLACVHRVAHHDDHPSLIWLWDIHLLASSLTPGASAQLGARAEQTQMAAVVAHGLQLARQRFGTSIDPTLMGQLEQVSGEPSARFIGTVSRPVELLGSDLAAAGSFGRAARLLREHLFPAPSYVRAKYASWPRLLLPLAYLHRIAMGAPKWLRRPNL
jgi:hypothetical protein